MSKLLNVGCGARYHQDWINMDVKAHSSQVREYNILKGIPFEENTLDAIYHSHVLEHFDKKMGKWFIGECHRVLKKGGTIRIAVPDLERIIKQYLIELNRSLENGMEQNDNYDWIMLELYDQTMRNSSGGEMAAYLLQQPLKNEAFVYERVGGEARSIRNAMLSNEKKSGFKHSLWKLKKGLFDFLARLPVLKFYFAGKFRLSGEVHYCMYDRYSLSLLLKQCGFEQIKVMDAFTSTIPNWTSYNLDSENGVVIKPDSLFIEAIKA